MLQKKQKEWERKSAEALEALLLDWDKGRKYLTPSAEPDFKSVHLEVLRSTLKGPDSPGSSSTHDQNISKILGHELKEGKTKQGATTYSTKPIYNTHRLLLEDER